MNQNFRNCPSSSFSFFPMSSSAVFLSLLVALLVHIIVVSGAPEEALITKVPGFNGALPSKHYGGYITIDETTGKNLYYYFVVSEGNPIKDPVVLWLNGGPGCSSFDGFVYEHGPFNFKPGNRSGSLPQLELNPYSWSKVSNIIYLDSPAGVGLSYSNTPSDYITGDLKTAADSHTFLLKWFEKYPEFLENPFFISGESYAGIYVPTLSSEVVKGIETGLNPALNFKGYLIGNGCTDAKFDGNALVPFTHGMGLISDELFKVVNDTCEGNFWNNPNNCCNSNLQKVDREIGNLNIYNILEPCYHSPEIQSVNKKLPQSFRMLGESKTRPFVVRKRMFGRSWPFKAPVREGLVSLWPELLGSNEVPCTNDELASIWLGDESVRDYIHARPVNALNWELCTGNIRFNHDAGSMISYHINLTNKGYRALIYSGDHDMCVPYTGSEAWTRSLGYKIVDEWRPWMFDAQVSGYTQGYDHNLTFLTVKGSGHTVPEYKPREALAFYSRWLAGTAI